MLTKKQSETLRYIKHYFSKNELSPTAKEIALGIGITSTGVVHRYLKALAESVISCLCQTSGEIFVW